MKVLRMTTVAALVTALTMVTGSNSASAQLPKSAADAANVRDVGATVQGELDSTSKGQSNSAAQGQIDSAAQDESNSSRRGQFDNDLSVNADADANGDVDSDHRATPDRDNPPNGSSSPGAQNAGRTNADAGVQSGSSNDLRSRMGLQFRGDSDGRLTVGQVTSGLAMQAGLQAGDEILSVGGQRVSGTDTFWRTLGNANGATTIYYWRNGRILQTSIDNANRYQAYYRGQGELAPPPPPMANSDVIMNGSTQSYRYPNQPAQYWPQTYYRRGLFNGWTRCR